MLVTGGVTALWEIDGIGNYLVISYLVYLAKDDTVLGERVSRKVASQASSQTKSRGLRSKARAKQSSCRSPNLWFSESLSHSVSFRTTKSPKT